MNLNAKQIDLLTLLAQVSSGAVVYGRAYAETAKALASRGLLLRSGMQAVVSMGVVEMRIVYAVSEAGAAVVAEARS